MKTEQPKEMETDTEAAARLIGVMDARRRKGAEQPINGSENSEERRGSDERREDARQTLPRVCLPLGLGGVRLRQGCELNVLRVQFHANDGDGWEW
jgi:hypothetical protein